MRMEIIPFEIPRGGNHVTNISVLYYNSCRGGDAAVVAVELAFSHGGTVVHGKMSKRGKKYRLGVFSVPEGDKITKAIVHSDLVTLGIEFETEKGAKSMLYGGQGQQKHVIIALQGEELCGMSGRAGDLVEMVVFHFGEPICVDTAHLQLIPLVEMAAGSFFSATRTRTHHGIVSGSKWSTENILEFISLFCSKVNQCTTLDATSGEARLNILELLQSTLSATHDQREYERTFELKTDGSGMYLYTNRVTFGLSNGGKFIINGGTVLGFTEKPIYTSYELCFDGAGTLILLKK